MKEEESTILEKLDVSQMLSSAPSLKARLANLEVIQYLTQKLMNVVGRNVDQYRKELQALKAAKDSFESVFDAKNGDIRKTISTEIERLCEELYVISYN